jgi:hypothetical protein
MTVSTHSRETHINDVAYRSPFVAWHEESWVRSGEPQRLAFEADLDYYSRPLVPILGLAEASALTPDEVDEVLALAAIEYLDFTVQLETGPVSRVCLRLATPGEFEWLPRSMREDALRICTDEGGHAVMSAEMANRVAERANLERAVPRPQFLRVLDRLPIEHPHVDYELLELLFVFVSETLTTPVMRPAITPSSASSWPWCGRR